MFIFNLKKKGFSILNFLSVLAIFKTPCWFFKYEDVNNQPRCLITGDLLTPRFPWEHAHSYALTHTAVVTGSGQTNHKASFDYA